MNYIVVVSEFNSEVTEPLLKECLKGFKEQKIKPRIIRVPGAFELPFAILKAIGLDMPSAVVALGAVIRGETDHYKAVCEAVTSGIMRVSLDTKTPVVFEVLMTDTVKKAKARIKKGYEASYTATRMAKFN